MILDFTNSNNVLTVSLFPKPHTMSVSVINMSCMQSTVAADVAFSSMLPIRISATKTDSKIGEVQTATNSRGESG